MPYGSAKRHQRELRKLKALQPERDAHNGYAEHQANNGVYDRKLRAGQHDPQDVEKYRTRARANYDFLAKGEECEL